MFTYLPNVENQIQIFWCHSKIKVKACVSGTGLPWMEHTILRDVQQMHTNCTSFYILVVLVHFVRSSAPLGALRHRSYVYQRSVMYSELYYWPSFLRLTAVLTQIPLILFIPSFVFKLFQNSGININRFTRFFAHLYHNIYLINNYYEDILYHR